MTEHESLPGLRPKIAEACRPSLRVHLEAAGSSASPSGPDAVQSADHVATCASCRRHLQAADVLAGALRQRPAMPKELSSPAFLEQVYERAVAMFEEGGSLVAELARPTVPPRDVDPLSGPRGLLASSVGALVGTARTQPSAWAWEKVRRSVRAETVRPAARFTRGRMLIATTVAATLAVGVFLVTDRSSDPGPEIRFVELGSAPAVEFAVLRHGLGR